MTTTLPLEGSVDQLRSRIAGSVYTRSDAGFAEVGQGWNLAFTHAPALIVVPRSAADVATAVRYASEHQLTITVQATGHGPARLADGSMLIVTSELNDVTVDAGAATARIGGGAKWQHVLGPATAAGLAPLLGSTPDVGVVGYTLGGGMGWIARKYGLSADHVRAIEIVTADGRIRTASPESEQDLFWALRGGGTIGFGVVTAIEIDLVPLASLYAGNLFYPPSMAGEVARRYREWIREAPEDLTSGLCFFTFPPVDEVPEPFRGRSFTIVRGALVGTDEEGEELLDHWRSWHTPEFDMWGRMPFDQVATISNDPLDPLVGLGTTEWLDEIDDDAIAMLARAIFEGGEANPLIMAEIRHAGGAISRAPAHPNAYGNRKRRHLLEVIALGMTPDDVPGLHHALDGLRAALAPHVAGGAYLNFLDGEEKLRRGREGFEEASWDKLQQVKAQVDPAGLFGAGLTTP